MISRRAVLGAGSGAVGLSALAATPAIARGRNRWDRLARYLEGDLVLPSDDGYAAAKQLELAQFDATNPQAIAYCAGPADVSLCLRFAQDHCLPIAVRSGGHSLGGYSTTPGLIIDVSRQNAIGLGDGTVTLGPGARNVDILTALFPHGLTTSTGACATVAAGGFITGGGYGFLSRTLGMSCDKMTSAEVVLASGRKVTASPEHNSELFWALQGGGGGNFGVITQYTVTPSAIHLVATANLVFPYDRADEVLAGYSNWMVEAPHAIGGAAFVALPDAAPGAEPSLAVAMVSTGSPAELQAEVARLTSFTGAPVHQEGGVLPYYHLMMGVFGCGGMLPSQCRRVGTTPDARLPRLPFSLERTRLGDRPLSAADFGQMLGAFEADRAAGQSHQFTIGPHGGAVSERGRGETAYVHRDALFTMNCTAQIADAEAVTPEASAVARQWVDGSFAAIDRHSNGETYQNYIDPSLRDWRRSYYAENYWRLARIKATYDPYRLFTFPQAI